MKTAIGIPTTVLCVHAVVVTAGNHFSVEGLGVYSLTRRSQRRPSPEGPPSRKVNYIIVVWSFLKSYIWGLGGIGTLWLEIISLPSHFFCIAQATRILMEHSGALFDIEEAENKVVTPPLSLTANRME